MPIADAKFSTFADGGDLAINDIVVGLRSGVNTRFNFNGFPGVYLPLAGGTMTGAINMDSNEIINLPAPTNPADAATKAYVDAAVGGAVSPGLINELAWYAASGSTISGLTTAASGLLVTSAGGVPSIGTDIPTGVTIGGAYIYRVGGTDVALADGGTNASLVASNGGIFYSTATAGAILAGTATARQMLQSGATSAPAWSTATWPATTTLNAVLFSSATNTVGEILSAASSVMVTSAGSVPSFSTTLPAGLTIPGYQTTITPAALTRVDDTNVTLTLGGTPSTALLQAVSLTLGWTGQLGLTRGGSNASLTADNGGIVYSTATALAILAATATAGQILRSGSNAAPSWSTATYPATAGTSGNVLTSDGTNWVSSAPADANVTITNDTTTNATMYPTWVTANTGTLPLKVTSTKLFYNPSTSVLTNVGALAQITAIQSSAGLNVAVFNYVASAVNSLALTNSITNTFPVLGVSGTDSNIGINFAVKGTGTYNFLGTSTTAAAIRLFEDTDNGDNYIGLKAPASISANLDFIIPSADGSANFPLVTDGSQTLSFGAIAAGAMALLGGSGMSGILNTTYDLSTASGNLDTTGLSFTPSLAIIVAAVSSGDPFSVGWFNGSTTFVAYARNNGGNNWVTTTSTTVGLQTSSGNIQSGVASFIAGGVRIAFTKTGTPTGTATISILCFK